MRIALLGSFLLCLAMPQFCLAQWPVTDAGNLMQNTISAVNSAKTAINTAALVPYDAKHHRFWI